MDDRAWVTDLMRRANLRGSEFTFANLFNWSRVYPLYIGRVEDFLILRRGVKSHHYSFPAGSGDLRAAVDAMTEAARADTMALGLYGVPAEGRERLDQLYPGRFRYQEARDNFDYIYLRESLATLAGKKLHGKRNHIARFKENNPDWTYERLNKDNLGDAWDMNIEWCRVNGCGETHSLQKEACAVRSAFENYEFQELVGGMLRAGGRVVAFTFGSPVTDDTFVVHVEKAFADVQGAYPMINQQFVLHELSAYTYVNREDDLGDEGLRRAKESYRPAFLYERYSAAERLDA